MPPPTPPPYPTAIAVLLPGDGQLELGPGTPRPETLAPLESLHTDARTWGSPPADREMASLCIAGLWLVHNYLDRSHRISQLVNTTSGSYWHGIMHRREGDFSNAKYWFRQVDAHPVFEALAATAHQLAERHGIDEVLQARWDPYQFVDSCQRAIHGDQHGDHHTWCVAVAQAEWKLLFDYCYRGVIGNQET